MTSDINNACCGVRAGDSDQNADISAHTARAIGAANATSSDSDRTSGRAVIGATTSSMKNADPSSAAPQIEYMKGQLSKAKRSSVTHLWSDTNGADDRQMTISEADVMRT